MKNWKQLIAAVAPALATALGGPIAGIAVREIGAKVLGNGNATEADIAQAVATGTIDLAKLKELDQAFAIRMGELGIELEKLETDDRANARAREIAVKDWVPSALACATCIAFFSFLFLMLNRTIPPENKDAFNILLGGLGGALTTVLTYYFGSSRGSSAKDEIIGRAATKKE